MKCFVRSSSVFFMYFLVYINIYIFMWHIWDGLGGVCGDVPG